MCTGIVENTKVSGSGRGLDGWYPRDQASVSYDHPDHAQAGRAVIIDFLNEAVGPKARIAVELTPESARNLVHAILASLSRAKEYVQRTSRRAEGFHETFCRKNPSFSRFSD